MGWGLFNVDGGGGGFVSVRGIGSGVGRLGVPGMEDGVRIRG